MIRDDELLDWLVLARAPGLGAVGFQRLLERFSSPGAVLEADPAALELPAPTRRYLRRPDRAAAERDLAWARAEDCHILSLHDPRYPELLRQTAGAPPLLFLRGDPSCLTGPQIAMVGSRNPTPAGRRLAAAFAAALARSGFTITSGLALGIDAESHRGALEAGGGTIAVLGSGPDRIYPARHKALAARILDRGGALVSELPPGSGPRPEHFPRRNRVISGLSLGCLVVEAALRSGSLITARQAADQGREVFAVPGSVHNPLARGCHALIRQGAKLVETVDDVLEELGAAPPAPSAGSAGEISVTAEERKLLAFMGFGPVSVDRLAADSGLTAERVCSMLLTLELRGCVASSPGGMYCRVEE